MAAAREKLPMRKKIDSAISHSTIFILFCLIFLSGLTYAQEEINRWDKFDPFLQRILMQQALDRYFINSHNGRPDFSSSPVGDENTFNVVIHGSAHHLKQTGIRFNSILSTFSTARVDLATLYDIADLDNIFFIEQGGLAAVLIDSSLTDINADQIHRGNGLEVPYTGTGVLIGIIDTGIDIFHPDFRNIQDQNRSRVISIWDVSLTPQTGEAPPSGFNYGVEYTRDDIESDLFI
jgi:subtilisin family serine protease